MGSVIYAMREKRTHEVPFQRVTAIEHIRRNKWKVRWVDPNPGLVDYVESGQLVVAWKNLKAFVREENNADKLREHNKRVGYDHDESPVVRALYEVYDNVGEGLSFYRGVLTGRAEAIARFRARIRDQVEAESPYAYQDRNGEWHLPYDSALSMAMKFCAVEPAGVLLDVETTERKWELEARHGADHLVGLLNEYRASWALIRQWAGHDAAIAQREAEIQRLERLVWDAIYALQKGGLDAESARLRRALTSR